MNRRMDNVLEFLEESAAKYPDKAVFADETQEITYREFVRRARRMATGLAKRCPPRSPVAVLGEKSVETVTAFFACVYAGCFYVPLNPLHPEERRKQILKTLGDPRILVQKGCVSLIPSGISDAILFDEAEEEEDAALLADIRQNHADTDPLYVLFTSGSTGEPKGIAVAHRSVLDFIDKFTDIFEIGAEEIIGNQAPFDFDVSVKDIYSTISAGATMQIIPKQKFSFPTILIDYLIERKITTLIWAVSALCILSSYRAFSYKVPADVKKVLFSGEVMPIRQLNEWKKYLPEAMFVNLYGPTEITCNCTYYKLEKGEFTGDTLPIGRPFPNERVFLLGDDGTLVKDKNVTGEICVAGSALSLGYYNNEEETAKAFVRNPLVGAYCETMYRTGDLGYYDGQGELCFVGRRDFQIKHMGHRIELNEIESAILAVGGVERAVCLFDQRRDKIWALTQGTAESGEIASRLREKLPPFMVPQKYIAVEKFPLTENGKINRRLLREEYGI